MSRRTTTEAVRVRVVPPFRLDFTVAALQRLPANPVDVWTEDGRYLRVFDAPSGPLVAEITQEPRRGSLRVRLHGDVRDAETSMAVLQRMLGCDVDLTAFYGIAAQVPPLAALAERFRGLKPPRFATLWESFVNTIAFQQLSLASGMASVRRLVERCARAVTHDGVRLFPFPAPRSVAALGDDDLRGCGFSNAKARALRAAADAITGGALREADLDRLTDADAAARLMGVPGVGPWTASLILLRGMGRLASFPAGDSGANRRFHAVFGSSDPAPLLATLDGWRGLLYFHLLLASRFAG